MALFAISLFSKCEASIKKKKKRQSLTDFKFQEFKNEWK